MATPLDVRVIDPSREGLTELLDRATRKANGRLRSNRLTKDTVAWKRFVQRHAKSRDGHATYKGSRDTDGAAKVTVAWWTDPLGRKHWRVQGGRTSFTDYWRRLRPLEAHPVWHVYPDRLAIRERDSKRELVALCGCGEAGPLDAIGWVGPCCGPCHDRREDGDPYAGPPHPAELPGDGVEARELAFAADGRLVRGNRTAGVTLWDPATGTERSLHARRGASLYHLCVSSTGNVVMQLTLQPQLAFARLDNDPIAWRVQRVASGCGYVLAMEFTPDGRSLLVLGTGGLFLLDPTGETPPRTLYRGRSIANLGFLDEGSRALAFDLEQGVTRLDLATGERIAANPRDRPPDGRGRRERMPMAFFDSGFKELFSHRSADGQWLACEGRWVNSSQLHLYHIPTGRWLPLPCIDYAIPPVLGFTRRGELLTVHAEGTLAVWEVTERTLVGKLQLDSMLDTTVFALSPDGDLVATAADERGTIRLWPWRRLLGLHRE